MSATRNLRNRSSRYSSPAVLSDRETVNSRPPDTSKDKNARQGNLDRWIEPPLRQPVASFEDTKGLERVGVLEHMAPLGAPPSQKMIQKLKLNFSRASLTRPTPVPTEDNTPPATDVSRAEPASPDDVEMLPVPPAPEEPTVISTPPRGRPAKRDAAEMLQSAADLTPSPVKSSFSPTAQHTPRPQSIQEHLRQDRLQHHIDRAIREAQQEKAPHLVPGLEQFRNDAINDSRLWNILESIVSKTPNAIEFRVFKRYIKHGMKVYLHDSNMQRSDLNIHSSHLVDPDTSMSDPSQQPLSTHHSPMSHNQQPANHMSEGRRRSSRSDPALTTTPFDDAQTITAVGGRSGNGHGLSNRVHLRQNGLPSSRKRSASASSSSSLSSARSIPEEFAPTNHADPLAITADDQNGNLKLNGLRQASTRVATGSNRLRSSGANQLPHLSVKLSTTHASSAAFSKVPSKKSKKLRDDPEFDLVELTRRKRDFLDDSFHDYNTIPRPESDEREFVNGEPPLLTSSTSQIPPPVIHPHQLIPSQAILSSPSTFQALPESRPLTNGTSRKRPYDEIDQDDLDGLSALSASPEPPVGLSQPATRGVTPRSARLPAPVQKTRKSARVMVSPNKPKNGGITAGIPRAGPGRDSLLGGGANSGAEDNDEYCAACGGEGKLLCCDGCPNSFHHACLEPPLHPDEEVDGEWYCPRCAARRGGDPGEITGILGEVILRVEDIIPKAFSLPVDVRDYFEGVRTGDEGEYEEVGVTRTNAVKLNRAGFIDEPNYKETRDSKGKLILCYKCGLSPNGRDIIPCDFCPAKWHLDCVDPPLAVPPRRRFGDRPNATWRCPLHAEHDLVGFGRQQEAAPGDLGRLPRLRKPRNALPVDVFLPRGFRNNGIIEVEMIKEDMPNIKEVFMDGTIHRVPESGIRLDFIDRVKKSWYEDKTLTHQVGRPARLQDQTYRPDGVVLHHPPTIQHIRTDEPDFYTSAQAIAIAETAQANLALRHRSIREQQAVLNLAEMSQKGQIYSGDSLAELTNQLISDAPPTVLEAMQQDERDVLHHLQNLINKRLRILDGDGTYDKNVISHKRVDSDTYMNATNMDTPTSPMSPAQANTYGPKHGSLGGQRVASSSPYRAPTTTNLWSRFPDL